MAFARTSFSRRGSKNDASKEDEDIDNNGYIQVLVKPLEQGSLFNLFINWIGFNEPNMNENVGVFYGIAFLCLSVLVYQICDMGIFFHRVCSVLVPVFAIVCAFYWMALYLRKSWSITSVYLLFSACFLGETLGQILYGLSGTVVTQDADTYDNAGSGNQARPLVLFVFHVCIFAASMFSSLETIHSAIVISLVSFSRFLMCSTLGVIPYGFRPYVGYFCGLVGFIVSKYMETVLKPPINNFMTHDGKIPVIRRRRSSSSTAHTFSAHRSTRRTSLPALIPKNQSSSSSYDAAIIGEAHGLITDMLADTTLPPHVVSGLRAVSNLLKPVEHHSSMHKTRVSPLVSLTESTSYGSDSEENPYTGERPSSLPKRLRRSLPPSLLRRMSTSTWTTTTSATGMPTLELEPCRVRSSSFRHSRDTTPGSSPVESRSNSPSPSSPTMVLTIPKSRSFSLAASLPISANASSHLKRITRKSVTPMSTEGILHVSKLSESKLSPLVKGELLEATEERLRIAASNKEHLSSIRKNITSDYESCNESLSSSDHNDNLPTGDEFSVSPPKKTVHGRLIDTSMSQINRLTTAQDFVPISDPPSPGLEDSPHDVHDFSVHQTDDESREGAADDEDDGDDDDDEKPSTISRISPAYSNKSNIAQLAVATPSDSRVVNSKEQLVMDLSDVDTCKYLQVSMLNEWDYPIFSAASVHGNFILSKIAYKLFMEVGLFETFRIPVAPFMKYFHALELGYRDKPYHNRVHATDVLHGVYYITTRPIPGFTQVSTTDMFLRQGSSNGDCERSPPPCRGSFAADDSYGIMGGNFPALELMAMFTAAAMHDYDHPGRTNAFLVATHAPQAVLYNDRSVLENHHAASAWNLFLSNPDFYFLSGLDQAEFKRFRYLVIEAILATDLKRHFEILAEFNAKVNDENAVGIDWTSETDRLLVAQMVIKLADINGPAKVQELHTAWTDRISEEFYEQGDEEARLGLPISPYMDRRIPQLAKLQETFIDHLVAPLCNTLVTAGLLPGTWAEEASDDEVELSDTDKCDHSLKDTEDEQETDTENGGAPMPKPVKKSWKINCLLTKNMKDNHVMWVAKIKEEEQQKSMLESQQQEGVALEKAEMEPITEESESPNSASPTSRVPDARSLSGEVSLATELGAVEREAREAITLSDASQLGDKISKGDNTDLTGREDNFIKPGETT
ncbi:cGMP-inhibited 3',5'-cyclic phosphodiesterase 3A-like isoform X2 [Dreissena polymorpha]|uniref:cGMP-inhibited 3',5'-cyclic phosphodiesterase 3A-like isoform X2 n=1 Tax=Dreissena polymorpha TaxID=45954 RepID=UPI002264DCB7|nr:cGMP-inhibited 3',5'-cyclic phosphodiesterase 3A-like isoform X2 [Dreissena polymorpha]